MLHQPNAKKGKPHCTNGAMDQYRTMTIPDYQTVMLPVLELLSEGGEMSISGLTERLPTDSNLLRKNGRKCFQVGNRGSSAIALPGPKRI
jgi:hypothetical protein